MQKVFIIAEAGVNHNGDMGRAKKMIALAAEAGADAVKFQTFKAENITTKDAKKAEYQIANSGSRESQYVMLKRLELGRQDFKKLIDYSRQKNIIFLSTPFDKDSVDLLDGIGVKAFKVASSELTNLPLLRYISCKRKPIILSTGMADLKEIKEAIEAIKKEGVRDITLLHCVTDYPVKAEDVNLKAMQTLKKIFKLPVGFSDHTIGIHISVAAVALGAKVIEKHFTLDKGLPGPDHKASLEPKELKDMVKAIRDLERALGSGRKEPTQREKKISKLMRKSIVARMDIPRGTRITGDMLDIKRPGTGVEPKRINRIIGHRLKKDYKKDQLIRLKDLL